MKPVDLLIIKPGDKNKVYGQLSSSLSAIEPPLWAALMAAYLIQRGYSVRIIDVEAEDLGPEDAAGRSMEVEPAITGFFVTGSNLSASTWHMTGAREYICAFRRLRPEARTFLWGLHPSALPERTLLEEGVEFVVQGEGFSTLAAMLGALSQDRKASLTEIPGLWSLRGRDAVRPAKAPLLGDLDALPTPAWGLLPMDRYRAHNWQCFDDLTKRRPYGVVYSSFGCPFNCSFCNLKALFGGPGVRYRSPRRVLEDIDALVWGYGVRNVKVLDECFVLNKRRVMEICDLLIGGGYDLNLWAYARIDTVDAELLAKLKRAGFRWLCYGIESGSTTILQGVSKRGFDRERVERTVRMTKEAGINIIANFMFGLPDDDQGSMRDTLALAKELNCEYSNFYATMAYPGSDIYEAALKDKVRLPASWRGYAAYSEECVPLPTRRLSAEQVLEFRDKAFVEFHSNPAYLEMVERKFGRAAADHLRGIVKHALKRNILPSRER
ncbi:MAG: cobalamin B12-binding domain-containing protein [Elusimicrobia bacterium]|nr:cobalamin B12-binding domain-containing protein [Elusimicrobiota bacterium]